MTHDADLATRLRSRGMRMTPQREHVLAAVRDLGHATPEQISDAVPGVDITTVYRTLEVLERSAWCGTRTSGTGPAFARPTISTSTSYAIPAGGGRRARGAGDELAARLRAEQGFVLDGRTSPSSAVRRVRGTQGGGNALTPDVTVIAEGVDAGVPRPHGDPLREQRVLASVAGVVDRSNRDVLIVPGMTGWPGCTPSARSTSPTWPTVSRPRRSCSRRNGHVEQHWQVTELDGTVWLDVEPGPPPRCSLTCRRCGPQAGRAG